MGYAKWLEEQPLFKVGLAAAAGSSCAAVLCCCASSQHWPASRLHLAAVWITRTDE